MSIGLATSVTRTGQKTLFFMTVSALRVQTRSAPALPPTDSNPEHRHEVPSLESAIDGPESAHERLTRQRGPATSATLEHQNHPSTSQLRTQLEARLDSPVKDSKWMGMNVGKRTTEDKMLELVRAVQEQREGRGAGPGVGMFKDD